MVRFFVIVDISFIRPNLKGENDLHTKLVSVSFVLVSITIFTIGPFYLFIYLVHYHTQCIQMVETL
jgi:uncharacterized membrane protein YesL